MSANGRVSSHSGTLSRFAGTARLGREASPRRCFALERAIRCRKSTKDKPVRNSARPADRLGVGDRLPAGDLCAADRALLSWLHLFGTQTQTRLDKHYADGHNDRAVLCPSSLLAFGPLGVVLDEAACIERSHPIPADAAMSPSAKTAALDPLLHRHQLAGRFFKTDALKSGVRNGRRSRRHARRDSLVSLYIWLDRPGAARTRESPTRNKPCQEDSHRAHSTVSRRD